MFKRTIEFTEILKDLSILLLGPRQTGKSTLTKSLYKDAVVFDLLDPELFRDLQKSPNYLKELTGKLPEGLIIIDEVQKIPELLDVVQSILDSNKKIRFILTGSSARKLRKQGQNLLGGRAYPISLHPITSFEYSFGREGVDLHKMLEVGGLPSVLNSAHPQRLLKAYIGVYLQEEIKAEGYARNLGDFSKFLEVAALTNAEQLDYAGVARDVQLSPRTVASYYQVLQDTLVGYLLESFKETKTRKAVITPKFYFFDVGVSQYLMGREKLSQGTSEYGKALEHFIFTELIAYRDYFEKKIDLFYWRTTSKIEVDFIVRLPNKDLIGIEVKGSSHIDKDDFKGLVAFEEDYKLKRKIVVSNERAQRLVSGGFEVYPYAEFCKELWENKIFEF